MKIRVLYKVKEPLLFLVMFILSLLTLGCSSASSFIPDTNGFYDGSHHWYDIFDEERVINPLPEQPRYKADQFKKIADNILLFQKNNGGWAKNYDMMAILSDEQIKAIIDDKSNLNTTFDNGSTHSQLSYLDEVYSITKETKYLEGFIKGINFILGAQYSNGGWPQFFPDTSGYRKYITFNDNAMTGVMALLQKISQNPNDYYFLDDKLIDKISAAYKNGISAILKCQIIDNEQKTAWCQQHDNTNFQPRNARSFELKSICNEESTEILKLLMNDKNPRKEILDAVTKAVKWFEISVIEGIRVKTVDAPDSTFVYHKSKIDRIVVNDPSSPNIWARFYELKTHKPIFVGRNGIKKYDLAEIDRDRRTGYKWYTYAPQEILDKYEDWAQRAIKHGEK